MKRIFLLLFAVSLLIFSCGTNNNSPKALLDTNQASDTIPSDRSSDDDITETNLIFKDKLCYNFKDESGNNFDYEIAYQQKTGILFVTTEGSIPMINGILIYPNGTYIILGQNEQGEQVRSTYKNGEDIIVQLKDEDGVTYPKPLPNVTIKESDDGTVVYRDGLKNSNETIKSKAYQFTSQKAENSLTLHLTDEFPELNARLLFGLGQLPGDVGIYFTGFKELWNISSKQWPTLIRKSHYAIEMDCFSFTDYHVDVALYKEEPKM